MFQAVFSEEPLQKTDKNVLTQSKTNFEKANNMSHVRESEQVAKKKRRKNPENNVTIFFEYLFTY